MACYICGYPSVLKCRQCGKSVCGNHYNYDDGRCTTCHDALFAKPEPVPAVHNEQEWPKPPSLETKPAPIPETKPMTPKARKGRK